MLKTKMEINPLKFNVKICRTCMNQFSDTSQVVSLDSSDSLTNSLTVREKLSLFVPELNLNGMFSSVICIECAAALEFVYAFKRKCLETDEQIKQISKKEVSEKEETQSLEIINVFSLSNNSDLEKSLNGTEANQSSDSNTSSVLRIKGDEGVVKEVNQNNNLGDYLTCDYTLFETLDIAFNKKMMLYKCNICSYNVTHKVGLNFHMKMHLKERSHWCNKCDVNKSLNIHLMNHIHSHRKKVKHYISTAFISRIIVYHKQRSRETLFSCLKCEYITPKVNDLKMHLKNHRDKNT
ncbi:hypothetical protein ILUMI_07538 [Ignelater luminosus]|uniref:Uncharacterized protein n=1 Tax=Ignelater luminosus TaxID=2038154 RepID=A0A8K0D3C0_IGNLU|nr:hypothetical protein ILUMI_07538 [Ignelater luminosus]